jgi:hypothetical protein
VMWRRVLCTSFEWEYQIERENPVAWYVFGGRILIAEESCIASPFHCYFLNST